MLEVYKSSRQSRRVLWASQQALLQTIVWRPCPVMFTSSNAVLNQTKSRSVKPPNFSMLAKVGTSRSFPTKPEVSHDFHTQLCQAVKSWTIFVQLRMLFSIFTLFISAALNFFLIQTNRYGSLFWWHNSLLFSLILCLYRLGVKSLSHSPRTHAHKCWPSQNRTEKGDDCHSVDPRLIL